MLSLAKCSLLSHGIWSLDKNGQHFADGIFKYPSSKKNSCNFIQVSWKFISWCQSGEISQLSVGRWWPGANYVTSWLPNSPQLTAPSHYLNQCWLIVNWTLRNKLQWNFNWNSKVFIDENKFENAICNFPAKSFQGEMSETMMRRPETWMHLWGMMNQLLYTGQQIVCA